MEPKDIYIKHIIEKGFDQKVSINHLSTGDGMIELVNDNKYKITLYKNLELVLLGKFKKSLFSKAINERIKSHIEFQEYENYIKSLSETDISLIPIKKSSFNECKSIVRLLDCCNAGVPSIASDIGDYRDSYDTMPFFEIASDNEWEEKICKLIEDSSLREFYSKNSREFIKSISSGFSGYISPDDFIDKIL